MDPGAELRYVVACAAFVGAVRGDIEAAVTAVRLAQLRFQQVEAAFAPAVVGSLQHDLGLVLRDMDQVLVYVVELEDRVAAPRCLAPQPRALLRGALEQLLCK